MPEAVHELGRKRVGSTVDQLPDCSAKTLAIGE